MLDPCQQSAPLALQCCRTNRRIARNNPPTRGSFARAPAALARSDRRAAIAAASRARAVAPADRRAPRSRRTRPSRRGDKRARGRGGAIGAGPRAVAIGRDDVEGGAVGGAGGGIGKGGGGAAGAGPRREIGRSRRVPPRDLRDRRFRGLASPERAFECAGRVRSGRIGVGSERDDEIPTARSMASNKYRPTEPIGADHGAVETADRGLKRSPFEPETFGEAPTVAPNENPVSAVSVRRDDRFTSALLLASCCLINDERSKMLQKLCSSRHTSDRAPRVPARMLAKRDLFALLVSAFAVYYGSRSEGAATFDPAFHVPLDEPHHRVGAFALGDAPASLGASLGDHPGHRDPPPLFVDLDGDGSVETVVASASAAEIRVLAPTGGGSRRRRRGGGLTTSASSPKSGSSPARASTFAPTRVLLAASTAPESVRVTAGREPVALGAGYLLRRKTGGDETRSRNNATRGSGGGRAASSSRTAVSRKAVIVAVTASRHVLCFDHNMRVMWETHLSDDVHVGGDSSSTSSSAPPGGGTSHRPSAMYATRHSARLAEVSVLVTAEPTFEGDLGSVIVGFRVRRGGTPRPRARLPRRPSRTRSRTSFWTSSNSSGTGGGEGGVVPRKGERRRRGGGRRREIEISRRTRN